MSEQTIKLLALWSFDFAFIEDANEGKCYTNDDNEKNIFSTKHDTICFAVPRAIDIIFENKGYPFRKYENRQIICDPSYIYTVDFSLTKEDHGLLICPTNKYVIVINTYGGHGILRVVYHTVEDFNILWKELLIRILRNNALKSQAIKESYDGLSHYIDRKSHGLKDNCDLTSKLTGIYDVCVTHYIDNISVTEWDITDPLTIEDCKNAVDILNIHNTEILSKEPILSQIVGINLKCCMDHFSSNQNASLLLLFLYDIVFWTCIRDMNSPGNNADSLDVRSNIDNEVFSTACSKLFGYHKFPRPVTILTIQTFKNNEYYLVKLNDYWVLLYVEDNTVYVTSVHAYSGTISCAVHDITTWNKYVSEGKIPLSVITGNYENIDSSPIFSIAYYYLSQGNIANIMRTYLSSLSRELSPEDQGNIMELQNRINIFSQIII